MGCLTFETAVENKSLAAFSFLVISGNSVLIAFTGVNSLIFCFFSSLYRMVYPNIFYRYIFLCCSDSHTFSFEYS